jgi:hypothetical protein
MGLDSADKWRFAPAESVRALGMAEGDGGRRRIITDAFGASGPTAVALTGYALSRTIPRL